MVFWVGQNLVILLFEWDGLHLIGLIFFLVCFGYIVLLNWFRVVWLWDGEKISDFQNLFTGGIALMSLGFYKMGKIMPRCLVMLFYILYVLFMITL